VDVSFSLSVCVYLSLMCMFLSMCFLGRETREKGQGDLSLLPEIYPRLIADIFKGLDLIEKVPGELCIKVHDIVLETGIKTIPKKKKCKKAKWLPEEALQLAVKRREAKGKGEKERYTYLNGEFQRITRRDKEAFLSD